MRPLLLTRVAAVAAVAAAALVIPALVADAATDTVLVNETFGAQTAFGFPAGASVADGVLNVTQSMKNYATSVKAFDGAVVAKKTLDLTFDWKTAIASSSHKTGIEFRDDKGNLVFGLAATAAEMRYGLTGPVSDSTTATDALNPAWAKITFDKAKWYTVNLHLDFTLKTVQYTITTKETAATVLAAATASITGTNLAKFVAANYYGIGVQSIDNFRLAVPASTPHGALKGKTVYAFGDSIVAGHKYARGFVNFTAEREQLTLTKYARNGATIGASDLQILTQVKGAAAASPSYVVFNGGTNDAYATTVVGSMASGTDPSKFNNATYAGSLETTLSTMRTKWPTAKIIYVAVHKLGSRDWAIQSAIRAVTLQICAKWGVTVADVFGSTTLDTRVDAQRVAYTFDNLANTFPGTGGTGTHPNIAGITGFYIPTLTAALIQS